MPPCHQVAHALAGASLIEGTDYMTEDTGVVAKIEREMKFTRSLVLLCTAAILGTLLLNITLMITQIPDLIHLKLESDLGPIQMRVATVQKTLDHHFGDKSAPVPQDTSGPVDK